MPQELNTCKCMNPPILRLSSDLPSLPVNVALKKRMAESMPQYSCICHLYMCSQAGAGLLLQWHGGRAIALPSIPCINLNLLLEASEPAADHCPIQQSYFLGGLHPRMSSTAECNHM